MFHLTLEAAKAGALKAHAENRLTAQHLQGSSGCVYRAGDCGCAIGVNLPPSVLDQIEFKNLQSTRIIGLGAIISTDNWDGLFQLQMAHDYWANRAASAEERFLALCAA